MEIHEVQERTECLVKELLSVWESSVRATHRFLDEPEILGIREYVPQALACVEHLVVAEGEGGAPIAFMGVQDGCLEMLFVHDGWRGRGIGSGLLEKAVMEYGVDNLAVNEQNPQAIGFYEHMGFVVVARSDVDAQGGPYPVLYMRLRRHPRLP